MTGKTKSISIAVLGAGIMGSSLALFLARRGAQVSLIDVAPKPFAGASRWNEGKIHLGFLYSADHSQKTTHSLLPGGLAFKPLTEELIGCQLDQVTTMEDDLYLVHKSSIVAPDLMENYFEAVAGTVRSHPDAANYVIDARDCRIRRLSAKELEGLANTSKVLAGFRVPERSVSTRWVADRYVEALKAEPRIQLFLNTRVRGIEPVESSTHGPWRVKTEPTLTASFDFVVNALWEGRLAVDATAGLKSAPGWSHRYRLAVFVRTTKPVGLPSAVFALGPFGDIKNYSGQEFYFSWYPAGLVTEGHSINPPPLPRLDKTSRNTIVSSAAMELSSLIPSCKKAFTAAQEIIVDGGWVFAAGRGSLMDPRATIHRRHEFGIHRLGSYISVDTGKYSVAPWLARQLADLLLAG